MSQPPSQRGGSLDEYTWKNHQTRKRINTYMEEIDETVCQPAAADAVSRRQH